MPSGSPWTAPQSGEGASQPQRQRVGVSVHDAAHEARESPPGVAVVGQGAFGGGYVEPQTVGAEPLEELFLAPVASVKGADADPGPPGHSRDRRPRVGDEHLPCSIEDPLVVARRLGPPATQRHRFFFGFRVHIDHYTVEQIIPFWYNMEQNSLFRYQFLKRHEK